MASKIKIGVKTLDAIPTPEAQAIYWDSDIPGFGVRVSPTGAKTFFCQGRPKGSSKLLKVSIGRYGKIAPKAARDEAQKIIGQLANGKDPRPDKKSAQRASTFGDMLTGYIDYLVSRKKQDWKPVQNAITKDIELAHPRLWKKPAQEIDIDDCMKIVSTISDAGKKRQADKVRSYIRTAFSEAIKARGNANAPAKLRDMRIKYNPARDMSIVEGSNNVGKRILELSEFRALWKRIKRLPEPDKSICSLYLLTGGQRQRQLGRTTLSDIDHTSRTLRLLDPKGRRTKAYCHEVPLLPEAFECIRNLTGSGEFIFSRDGGLTHSPSPMRKVFDKLCLDMAKAGELSKSTVDIKKDSKGNEIEYVTNNFTPKAVRATIETRLTARPYRVRSDVLARLLSHGLGGVQNRNYQGYEFAEEKLDALQKLYRLLEGEPEPTANNVIQMTAP